MRQYTTPKDQLPPWFETTWELAMPELVRPRLGMSFSGGERNQLFLNLHGDDFKTVTGVSGVDDPGDPRGFCYGDFNRDGFSDFALATRDTPSLQLFENRLPKHAGEHGFIAVRFVGGNDTANAKPGLSPRDAFGATVRLSFGGHTTIREHRAGEGWRTQNSQTMLIGLGTAKEATDLTVRWPSGREQTIDRVPAGSLLTVTETAEATTSEIGSYDRPSRDAELASAPKTAPAVTAPLPPADAEFTVFTSMATWCVACKKHLVNLHRLRDAVPADQIAMVGVPVDPKDSAAKLATYLEKNAPPYELDTSMSAADRARFKQFMVQAVRSDALPATLIVRRDGTPVYASMGTPTLSEVRDVLARSDVLALRTAHKFRTPPADDANRWFLAAGGGAICLILLLVAVSRRRRAAI